MQLDKLQREIRLLYRNLVPECLYLMDNGYVALMDYRCFHNGGANTSEDLRCVLYATFASEGDHHSYSLESKAQTRRLGEFLSGPSIVLEAT